MLCSTAFQRKSAGKAKKAKKVKKEVKPRPLSGYVSFRRLLLLFSLSLQLLLRLLGLEVVLIGVSYHDPWLRLDFAHFGPIELLFSRTNRKIVGGRLYSEVEK